MKTKTKKVDKKNKTIVNFILDKSGSMSSVCDATISGFNEYLNTLKKDGNNYDFSLTLFDTEVKAVNVDTPIKKVDELNDKSYAPYGATALYDAVCKTVNEVKKKIKKGTKVLTVIMTDGEENSSREYTEKELKTLITELEATKMWSFVFLGANQDAWANVCPKHKRNYTACVDNECDRGEWAFVVTRNSKELMCIPESKLKKLSDEDIEEPEDGLLVGIAHYLSTITD